jgi:GT2 family glycosyltransferase
LIKRSVWERVGPMDDRFFLYYEEADLCARARAAGWRAVTAPAGRLWHKVSRSTGEGSALTLYYMRRNVLRYLERCAPHPLWARLDAMADLLRLMAVWQLRGNGERARVLRWALGDYLRGRMGRSDRF